MLKKVLLVLPLIFMIGCRNESNDESAGSTKTYTQEQIESGEAPSAAKMGGGGEGNREESDD